MRRILLALFAFVVLIAGAGAAVYFTGNFLPLVVWLTKPDHGWDPTRKVPDPNYASAEFWAARPGKVSPADLMPAGVSEGGKHEVDVFFVHPTGYLNGGDWNSPMNPNSRTEENTKWMMSNQASAFNGCCDVYAPRYREASIFRYLGAPEDIATKSMDFAYADVVRAFEYYMANDNHGRPFIIASHSQGTSHAFRLIQEKIDGTPLAQKMVAGYLIGSRVMKAEADALKTVKVCDSDVQVNCIVHWATYGEGGKTPADQAGQLVCVNPLSWKRDGGRADAASHKGGVPATGQFSTRVWGDDSPQGITFGPLGAPVAAATWAECRDGFLMVADQAGGPFAGMDMGGKNYHGLDYPLFYMDIRMNAEARVKAYLATAVHAEATGAEQSAPR